MIFYDKHKEMIETIYHDLKLNVILDIDMTLLEAIYVENTIYNMHKHPDYILTIEMSYLVALHLTYFRNNIKIYKFNILDSCKKDIKMVENRFG